MRWFIDKSCQRKGGDRSLAEEGNGQVEEDKCVVQRVREGSAALVCCAYTTTRTLSPSDPTIPDFFPPSLPYYPRDIPVRSLLPATVKKKLVPPVPSSQFCTASSLKIPSVACSIIVYIIIYLIGASVILYHHIIAAFLCAHIFWNKYVIE